MIAVTANGDAKSFPPSSFLFVFFQLLLVNISLVFLFTYHPYSSSFFLLLFVDFFWPIVLLFLYRFILFLFFAILLLSTAFFLFIFPFSFPIFLFTSSSKNNVAMVNSEIFILLFYFLSSFFFHFSFSLSSPIFFRFILFLPYLR